MFKRDNVPPSRPPLRLAAPPTSAEIGEIFSESMRQTETRLFLSWPNSDKTTEFHLSVYFPNTSNEAFWEFFYGPDRQKDPLWAYVTSDSLLVYNLVTQSIQSVEHQNSGSAKPQKQSPADYKDLYMLPSAYYSTALDMMADSQKKQSVAGAYAGAAASAGAAAVLPGSLLHGDLALVDLSNLMQSVNLARLTGRLALITLGGPGEVYFEQGLPVQAAIGGTVGDEAILQLFIQRSGEFHFEADVPATKKNIRQKFDDLMLKGVLLRDKARFLFNAGLKPASILVRKHANLAEAEFEKITTSVASGSYLTFSMMAQKEFYMVVDDNSTIREIADKLRLTDSQWIPILCRMLKADFIELVNKQAEKVVPLQPKMLDRNAIHSVMLSLRRPESGLYTFPAFAYFLDQEYIKARRSNRPLSLVIIDARVSGGNFEYRSPLPSQALSELVRRASAIKRDVDVIGHYEIFDIGIILPDTNSAGATVFAQRLLQVLRETELSSIPDTKVTISAGIASAPEHVGALELLVAAAEAAKDIAQHAPNGIATYSQAAALQGVKQA